MIGLLKGCMWESVWEVTLIGRPQQRWIDSVNDCLKKRGLNVGLVKRMVRDSSKWRGFVREMLGL